MKSYGSLIGRNGGYYWEKNNKAAQKTFEQFNPMNSVDKWNTPIMIIQGGRDYRVPVEQGLRHSRRLSLKASKVSSFISPMKTTGY